MRVPRSLAGRLVLAMLAVAVVALLLAATLTSPLVRSSTEGSARSTLARQADLFAALARPAPLVNRLELQGDVRGLSLDSVSPRGRSDGVAALLRADDRRRLLAGDPVSTTVRDEDGEPLLVEARPTRSGGAVVLATGADTVDRAVAEQRRRLLLALTLALLVAVGIGVVVARQLGRPLARLAEDAGRLGAGERGTVRAPVRGGTREVEEVAAALRRLDDALASSEGRQRRFLLSVSHELRTPLTAVLGYAESLADGVVGPEELPEVGVTMVGEARRLERYVADLLDLARLEADELVVHTAPCDAAEVVREAARAWGDRCERAGLSLRVETEEALPVESDPLRLRQVVDALADNAVRICSPGDSVVLAAVRAPGVVRLEVRDSGPGLDVEDAATAFEPGVLHEKYDERAGGLGLGLSLVQGLVRRLGGTVAVGRGPEGGAAFRVDLPG
ncbi:two-component sensor histidine kinase [Marmoricola endophyticus]|uniref:histidine kinase n=1 Tax=Marmoricola endophyticus TaxID=2040280 RepID=A0A917BFJ5_9ACTN|nr:HAMP domain-containing sensor histidine kinase [Marmoricola endophyticus]GGF41644.1 two-component sensor histidine kinase [Marmoricola endophyticus]